MIPEGEPIHLNFIFNYSKKDILSVQINNSLTPYLVVDVNVDKVRVPLKFVQEDGKIILDISPKAISGLQITSTFVEFEAKFQGEQEFIFVPLPAIVALYTQENGRGMVFDEKEELLVDQQPIKKYKGNNIKYNNKAKGHLRLVTDTVTD